jgi:LysM repeat protein
MPRHLGPSRPALRPNFILATLAAALLATLLSLGAIAPAAAQGANLLYNGSFEFGYYHQDGIPELAVPLNWRVHYVDNGTFPGILPGQVAFRPETVVWHRGQAPEAEQNLFWRDGDYTLKVFKPWAPLYAALSQNVSGLQAGASYQLTAYVFVDVVAGYDGAAKVPPANDSEHNDDVLLRLGAGRPGAAWRDATAIRYSAWATAGNRPFFHQASVPLSLTFQATGPQMSVWIEMMSVAGYQNNGFFVDAVSLTGPGGTAGAAALPAVPAGQPPAAAAKTASQISLANATTYTVQPGDSIFKIAKKVGVPAEAILAVNTLADARLIRPGQTLIIPDPTKFYTVQRGDTLSAIALKYGTTVQTLQAINRLGGANIFTGQILVVP